MALIARRARPKKQDTNGTPLVLSALSGPMAASSANIPPEKWGKIGKTASRQDWQQEAWDRVHDVGELRFAVNWKKALVSRFRLIASDLDPETGRPTGATDNNVAKDIVRRIAGGVAGQSQLIGRYAVLHTVVGEAYLAIIFPDVKQPDGTTKKEEQWHILSREEIKAKSEGTEITLPDETKYLLNEELDTLSRIWESDAQKTWEADSAVRSALPILREIVRMTQNIEGAGKSRQAGNGILVLPEEISMPHAAAPTGAPDADAPDLPPMPPPPIQYVTADEIRQSLQAAMATAIKDPAAAEALVPIILQTKGDWIDKIRHLKFDSEVQAQSVETREKAVRRLALTLDMPAEVLLGLADLNHWSLWGVEDEALRWHSAPTMETLCDGLTEHLLRPMLVNAGVDPENLVVWYDQSDVESDPDHDQHIKEAYELGLLRSEAYLREIGVSEDDGYDLTKLEDWGRWAADQVRKDPSHLTILAPILRVTMPTLELPEPPPPQQLEPPDDNQQDNPDEEDDTGGQGPPDTQSQALMLRMCVNRAMNLAAKRRRTRANYAQLRNVPHDRTHVTLGPCPADDVDRLIDGWDDIVDQESCRAAGVHLGRLRTTVRTAASAALRTGTHVDLTAAQIRSVRQ
ncbi:hypothetical protein [Rhodococcus koreensis]